MGNARDRESDLPEQCPDKHHLLFKSVTSDCSLQLCFEKPFPHKQAFTLFVWASYEQSRLLLNTHPLEERKAGSSCGGFSCNLPIISPKQQLSHSQESRVLLGPDTPGPACNYIPATTCGNGSIYYLTPLDRSCHFFLATRVLWGREDKFSQSKVIHPNSPLSCWNQEMPSSFLVHPWAAWEFPYRDREMSAESLGNTACQQCLFHQRAGSVGQNTQEITLNWQGCTWLAAGFCSCLFLSRH